MRRRNRLAAGVLLRALAFFTLMLTAQAARAQCEPQRFRAQFASGDYVSILSPLLNCAEADRGGMEIKYMFAKSACKVGEAYRGDATITLTRGCEAFRILWEASGGRPLNINGRRVDLRRESCCHLRQMTASAAPAAGVDCGACDSPHGSSGGARPGGSLSPKKTWAQIFADVRANLPAAARTSTPPADSTSPAATADTSGPPPPREATVPPATSTAPTVDRFVSAGGPFRIVSRSSLRCLDVPASSRDDSVRVDLTRCADGTNQQWVFVDVGGGYHVIAQHSGKCLDVDTSSRDRESGVIQYGCHDGDNQKWQVVKKDDYVQLVAKHSGKCLQVSAGAQADGALLVQADCADTESQLWRLMPERSIQRPAHVRRP